MRAVTDFRISRAKAAMPALAAMALLAPQSAFAGEDRMSSSCSTRFARARPTPRRP